MRMGDEDQKRPPLSRVQTLHHILLHLYGLHWQAITATDPRPRLPFPKLAELGVELMGVPTYEDRSEEFRFQLAFQGFLQVVGEEPGGREIVVLTEAGIVHAKALAARNPPTDADERLNAILVSLFNNKSLPPNPIELEQLGKEDPLGVLTHVLDS